MKNIDTVYDVSYMSKQRLKMGIQGWPKSRKWAVILFSNYKK